LYQGIKSHPQPARKVRAAAAVSRTGGPENGRTKATAGDIAEEQANQYKTAHQGNSAKEARKT